MDIGDLEVRFEGSCTIVEAEAHRERLLDALSAAGSRAVDLDLCAVEAADITLVQLLLSAQKTAAAKGTRLTIKPSPVVADLFARAGLSGWPEASAA